MKILGKRILAKILILCTSTREAFQEETLWGDEVSSLKNLKSL